MANVVFVVRPDRSDAKLAADSACRWLETRGHGAVQVRPAAKGASVGGGLPTTDEQLLAGMGATDLAVSLGGDGTMLRAVALAVPTDTPVLGVNLGRLGYLTEVEPGGLVAALERFLAGQYSIEERMTLTVEVVDAGGKGSGFLALNEAVVEKTVPGHTIRLDASVAGRPFVTYAADGLLVSTPTGSTAYNLSVRGPIVSPSLRAMVVTPISPHMLFDRPLVLEPDEALGVVLAGPRPAVLVIDGLSVGALDAGDRIECRAGPRCARLVTFGERHFHAVLRSRFHLADR